MLPAEEVHLNPILIRPAVLHEVPKRTPEAVIQDPAPLHLQLIPEVAVLGVLALAVHQEVLVVLPAVREALHGAAGAVDAK